MLKYIIAGNPVHVNATCTAGLCAGVDPCANVVCAAPAQCFQPGVCQNGSCLYSPLPLGTTCLNSSPTKYQSVCTSSGVCVPLQYCDPSTCISWATEVNLLESTNFGLVRFNQTVGWTAGAISLVTVTNSSQNVGFVFTLLQSNANVLVGLTKRNNSISYLNVDYGIWCTQAGTVLIYESGVLRSAAGSYSTADVFEVRVGFLGAVEYIHNGLLLYTSKKAVTFPLFAQVSMYSPAEIRNIAWSQRQTAWCQNVTCPAETQCTYGTTCSAGVCSAVTNKVNGLKCSDARVGFVNASCSAGQCIGTDVCSITVCKALDQCHIAGSCIRDLSNLS